MSEATKRNDQTLRPATCPCSVDGTVQGSFEDTAIIDVFEGPGRAVPGPLRGRGNLLGITGIQ